MKNIETNCSGQIYVIQSGDSLWLISKNYNVTLDQIISANPSVDTYSLQVGQEICIPASTVTDPADSTGIADPIGNRESLTYLYGGTSDYYLNLLSKTQNSIKTVNPDYFELSSEGNLLVASPDKLNSSFIQNLHNQGIKVVPFLTNNWNRSLGEIALDNRENLSNQIVSVINQYGLDGIDVDIENVTEKYRAQYTDFIRLLRQKLSSDKIVSVAVAANPSGVTTGWAGAYDYKALSDYADHLMIMAYDESYQGGPEGPVASSEFLNASIKYALEQGVPQAKIVVGIPFYGRYWKVGEAIGGIGIAGVDVQNLLKNYTATSRFDDATKSAYAEVTINPGQPLPIIWGGRTLSAGTYHIWYDNEEATKYKLTTINGYNLKGAGSWALGQEIPNIWSFYTQALNGTPVSSEGSNVDMTKQETLDFIYPIGSVYMSVNSANPGNFLGGTWIRWGNGKTIVAVDENDPQGYFKTSEWVGGERNHRHDFRVGMHWWYGAAAGERAGNGTGAYRYSDGQYDGWSRALASKSMIVNTANYNSRSSVVANPDGKWSLGNTDVANNWPPCITCYIWKRTA